MFRRDLFEEKLPELRGETLEIKCTPDFLSIRLLKVVATTNYKALARFGRFDPRTKTAYLNKVKDWNKVWVPEEGVTYMQAEGETDAIPLPLWEQHDDEGHMWYHGDGDKVLAFCKRMQKGRAKTYDSLGKLAEERKARTRAAPSRAEDSGYGMSGERVPSNWKSTIKNPYREPEWMDIPVWDKELGEWYDAEY